MNPSDFRGLGFRTPMVAGLLTVLLLGLIGMPFTAGFWAKLQVFLSAVVTGNRFFFWTAILMALSTVVSVFYYARIILLLYDPNQDELPPSLSGDSNQVSVPLVGATVSVALTLAWFIFPNAM